MSIGKAIRQWRKERGLSMRQLSLLAECSAKYIGMIERGEKQPGIRAISDIAYGLRVPLPELYACARDMENERLYPSFAEGRRYPYDPAVTGAVIRHWRIKRRMPQNELARRASCSTSSIYKIEHGTKMPSPEFLESICAALRITLSQFEYAASRQP